MTVTELPAGVVTFLFTDIEGSTRLMDELGEEAYVEALAEHRRLLRAEFVRQGGVEVDTQGDAFLYAFAAPGDALEAAARGQQALSVGPVRVRMGLHTGDVRLTGEGYAGRELHRAARIAASAHGGQVVVSAATAALVDSSLEDLGEHRLKDFAEPVALFQLGRERFPPLKTISNTNLPRPASSFVGRALERQELAALLRNGSRLVTISGPGGSGKTRLALQAATELVPEFRAGVFWVGLAQLREAALVTQEIARAVGAKDELADHIADREMLLVLDNFEQVVDAAPELGALLERCANRRLVVTSRELLRIRGEVEYPVPPLAAPDAAELFCQRSGLRPDETIAELCRRLDELPLAIELAAARTSVLSPAQILDRLSQRLDLLKGGRDAEPRQRTLRTTIEWSYELLEEGEQQLLARLAVFRGGCTLDAAEQVAGADLDTLQSLVDKSLLRHTGERFWMLETIREFASERLAAGGEEVELRRAQALFALAFAEAAYQEIDEGGDQALGVARFDAEYDNLRAALEWAHDSGADEVLLRLAAALGFFWGVRGYYLDLVTWSALALERAPYPVTARIEVLRTAAIHASGTRDYERWEAYAAEWFTLAEQMGDEYQLLKAMNSLALAACGAGRLDAARAQFVEIRRRASEIDARDLVAFATINLGTVARGAGDFGAALAYSSDAVALFGELQDDGGAMMAHHSCGWDSLALAEPANARAQFLETLAIAARLGWRRGIASIGAGLAASLVALDEAERAAELAGAATALFEELGAPFDDEFQEETFRRAIADARSALADEVFAAAWARGETMTTDEIVDFARAG